VLATLLTIKHLNQPALPDRVQCPRLIEQLNSLRSLASLAVGRVANVIGVPHEASRIFLKGLRIAVQSHSAASTQCNQLQAVPV
jgi:hypothetical protein